MRKSRKREISLDEKDLLIVPANLNDDPLLCWCNTTKFNRSFCLKDEKTGRTLIFINIQDLKSRNWQKLCDDRAYLVAELYLDYLVLHELVHYGDEEETIKEKVWDKYLINLLVEMWSEKNVWAINQRSNEHSRILPTAS